MKRMLNMTAVALVAAVLFSIRASAVEVSAASAILIDADTGAVLYSLNADEQALIASTTKIMTACVVLANCDLQTLVEIPEEAVGIEGSSLYLQTGEALTIEALLYGLMLHSGNDAAVALAVACSGSLDAFVTEMNAQAAAWGLMHTHFTNPSGLDDAEHYATAADLARMTACALRDDTFREIVSTRNIVIGGRHLSNHNRLLWSLEGAMGVKTGYTRAAGRVLVSAAERKGRRLIAVTIRDGNDWHDHASLYDYGFAQYSDTVAVEQGDVIAQIPALNGGSCPLLAGETFEWAMAQEEHLRIQVAFPKLSYGTQNPGEPAGWAVLSLGERQIGTIPVLWGEGINQNERTNSEDHCCAGTVLPAQCRAAPA